MKICVTLNLLGVRPFDLREETMLFELASPPTLGQVIDLVDQRNPGFGPVAVDAVGRLSRQFAVLVNGINAYSNGGTAVILADGDIVNIIPAIAGG